jgi:hypothetical protein
MPAGARGCSHFVGALWWVAGANSFAGGRFELVGSAGAPTSGDIIRIFCRLDVRQTPVNTDRGAQLARQNTASFCFTVSIMVCRPDLATEITEDTETKTSWPQMARSCSAGFTPSATICDHLWTRSNRRRRTLGDRAKSNLTEGERRFNKNFRPPRAAENWGLTHCGVDKSFSRESGGRS